MNSLLNSTSSAVIQNQTALNSPKTEPDSGAVLVREAGVPFRPSLAHVDPSVDPFTEWLSLMEVVQMLCPAWPVRDKPMLGRVWKL
jgi:hypothetical protein